MGSKVISFRLDDDKLALLKQHQVVGESENQTAMRLLLEVLGVEGKKVSLQSVDIVDSIRTEIKQSIADGDIKEAIATSYEATMGQFNGLLEELQALQKQVQELQSNPPAAVPSSQSPITNEELPENTSPAKSLIGSSFEQSIINLVPIGRLIGVYGESPIDGSECGELYHKQYLIENELFFHLKNHQQEVEKKLKIKLSLDNDTYAVREMNKILKALGYELGHKQINKVETYWVINPQK